MPTNKKKENSPRPKQTTCSCFPCTTSTTTHRHHPSLSTTSCTSTYRTPLGHASLTWSRSLLGLSLTAFLPLTQPTTTSSYSYSCSSSSTSSSSTSPSPDSLFHLRPYLPWTRRGRKRFRRGNSTVLFSWDLSGATFSQAAPEPVSGFHVSVSVNGEVVLVVGDGRRKGKGAANGVAVSRRERVVVRERKGGVGSAWEHVTSTWVHGRERSVAVQLGGRSDKDVRMCLAIDGKRILQVKRLRWKFRGTQRIDLDSSCGSSVLVSWDVRNYLFPNSTSTTTTSSDHPPSHDSNDAMILFRFETEADSQSVMTPTGTRVWGLYSLLSHVGLGEKVAGASAAWRKRLTKTKSASSASSVASTGSAWSVAEWQSAEENELKEGSGFSLLIVFARH